MPDLVVIGGGFAGTWAALAAARQSDEQAGDIRITLVTRDPFLTIRPRLYEREPHSLRVPLGRTLDPAGIAVLIGTVSAIDADGRTITLADDQGKRTGCEYDRLVLAAGSVQRRLPVPGAGEHSWNIDSLGAAEALDQQLRQIARHLDRPGNDTVVVIGAGFTGIELATELRSRIEYHGGRDVAARARIVLIERSEVVAPDFGQALRTEIEHALRALRVEVRTGVTVEEFRDTGVLLNTGREIATSTAIVTAGLEANPLTGTLPADRDELGRLHVDGCLRVDGVDHVFAAGDVARAHADPEHLALMSCQHAMPMGRIAGYNAARDLMQLPLREYSQPEYVTCLDLGNAGAVFTTGWNRQIALTGAAAKAKKRAINTERIYPPTGDRDAVLAAADIVPRRPP